MDQLLAEIKQSLNQIANGLFDEGLKTATKALNDTFEELAFNYANHNGLAFGKHRETHISSQNQESKKRIVVFRERGKKLENNDRDVQGRFLFDHCWLVYYNGKASNSREGRLLSCELAMESEWNFDNKKPDPEFIFLQDFRKLLVSNAKVKVFIFRSKETYPLERTFEKLRSAIKNFDPNGYPASRYLLCGWYDGHFYCESVPDEREASCRVGRDA